MRPYFALALLMLAAACSSPVGPYFYLLEAPAGAAQATAPSRLSVGVREIGLPLYARRPQMAVRDETGAIVSIDEHRWADDPPHAATRLVARRLATLRGAPAYVDPWPQGAEPDLIATVEVDRFLGALGGEVAFDGQYTVADVDRREGAVTRPFAISVPVQGSDYAALAAAYGEALSNLADILAEALNGY